MLLACRDKSEARRWWLVQARRVSRSIYAPLGPICLEHQDLCRPRLLRPWAFESSTDLLLWLRTTSSSRHEGPGESRAPMLFRGVAQGKMLQETREGTTDYGRQATNCETRSKLKETTRTRNRVHRECTVSWFNDTSLRLNDAYIEDKSADENDLEGRSDQLYRLRSFP